MTTNENRKAIPIEDLVPGKLYDIQRLNRLITRKKFMYSFADVAMFEVVPGLSEGFVTDISTFYESPASEAAPNAAASTGPPNGGKKTKRRRSKKRKTINRKRYF
jgi:hypothetical protein